MDTRTLEPERTIDLGLTLSQTRHGFSDPTCRIGGGAVLRATRTPEGSATVSVRSVETTFEVRAWGPGAGWSLEHAHELVGMTDNDDTFEPGHPIVARMHRKMSGLRMCKTSRPVEALLPRILEQKVTSAEARRSYVRVVRALRDPAPGPGGLLLPPDPSRVAELPYWWFHRFGIERRRAETLLACCRAATRLEETTSMRAEDARPRLRAVPGIGPWTAASVLQISHGDPDAVVVGDFHLPHIVAWTLAGETLGSDERMLELLEPFRGHRGRVLRLVAMNGGRSAYRGRRHPIRRMETF